MATTDPGSDAAKPERDHKMLSDLLNRRSVAMAIGYAIAKAAHEKHEDWNGLAVDFGNNPHMLDFLAAGLISVITHGGADKLDEMFELFRSTEGQTAQ